MASQNIVAQWIEERRQEQDAPALAGVIEGAARALLDCYPENQGQDTLWALFRRVVGPEQEG